MENKGQETVPMSEFLAMKQQMLEKQSSMEERLWVDSRLTQFDDVLRDNYDKSLEDFSLAIITHLSESTEAMKGAFFNVDHDNKKVYASAGYACTLSSMGQDTFGFGEGFVGQSVLSQKFQYITNIPSKNLFTKSSLGNLSAGTMFIVPLIFNKKVYGVIELLYLFELENKFLDLIKRLSVNIASMLQSIQSNSKTKVLYLQSLKQAEELRAQEEEMRQSLEELSATQDEMKRKEIELMGQLAAINSSCATIMFKMDSTIIEANTLFLNLMEYELNEVSGQSHQMFVTEEYGQSKEYKRFWDNLRRGIPQTGEFKRISKTGRECWISASYTPVKGLDGQPYKVIKIAIDITDQKKVSLDFTSQLESINKSNAVIEFELSGHIISANQNFLDVVGYNLDEIKGKHHSVFVTDEYKASKEYADFWDTLQKGKHIDGEFSRIDKNNNEFWINGSYNPLLDENGKPYKVIKYATDITKQKKLEGLARDSQVLSDKILNDSIDGILTFNSSEEILFFNPSAEKIWGYKAKEVVGEKVSSIIKDFDGECDKCEVFILMENGEEKKCILSLTSLTLNEEETHIGFVKEL